MGPYSASPLTPQPASPEPNRAPSQGSLGIRTSHPHQEPTFPPLSMPPQRLQLSRTDNGTTDNGSRKMTARQTS